MSLQSPTTTPAWPARAAIAATGVVVLLMFLAGAAGGVGTAERDYRFSPTDPPWAQSMLPALDSPYAAPWSPSALAGRAAMAIALGRRTALRDLAAVASAAAVTVLGLCLLASGLPLLPVLIAMIGMAAGSTFWWRGVLWTSDALAPAFALCAAWAGWRWTVTGRPIVGSVAGVAAALAMAEDSAWLACLPAAAVFWWERLPSRARRGAALAALTAVGACALWPVLASTTAARRALWAPLAGVEPPRPFALSTALVDVHLPSLGSLPADLAREFTPLGTALLIIGTVALWSARRDSRRGLAALAIGLIGWHWFVPHSDLESVSLPVAVSGWATVAVGLHWVQQAIRPRAGPALVILLGLVIAAEPLATRARLGALGRDRQSEQQAKMAYDFKVSDLPAGAAIVAESRRVDAALLLSSQRAGTPATIVPQHLASLEAVVNRGRPLFAFSNGRANLAPFGFLFERSRAGAVEVAAVVGRTSCADLTPGEWADVSLLLATGSFIVHGAGPGTAPGGVILRLTDAEPARFASIEPRSIPYFLEAATGGATTLRIPATGRTSPVTFTFVTVPQNAVATAEGNSPVMICPGLQGGDATLGRNPAAMVSLPMTSAAFGPGWHSAEADPDPFRWTSAPRSSIRISVAPAGPIHVTITATPAARSAQKPAIAFTVNACAFPAQPMPPGQGDYEWDVPSNCWRAGANQLWVGVTPLVSPASLTGSPDTRLLGARVGAVRLARVAQVTINQNAK